MDLLSIILLAVALAMDAFSVSISSGLTLKKCGVKHAIIIALFFGGFQAIMPVIGWFSGLQLQEIVKAVDHWIAFILLSSVGVKMIYESLSMQENEEVCTVFSLRNVIILSIATSIDAFAVGVTFAFLNVSIIEPIIIIGFVTFVLSFLGFYIGKKIGHLFESKIEIIGGLILIAIGFKILFEHLFS